MNEFYQKSIEEIYHKFNTSKEGISDKEGLVRLTKYGLNELQKIKSTPVVFKFFNQFTDLLVIILMIIGLLALIIGEPRDAMIIFSIVLINAVIGFTQEYKAEKILSAFKRHLPSYAKVIRAGQLKKILTAQLVPGDILFLEAGDSIGADGRLIESYNLKTNDLPLTGESQAQAKKTYQIKGDRTVTDIDNVVFMGTSVVEGEARAVVVTSGMSTELGKIAQQSQKVDREVTPLQKEMIHTSKTVTKIAIGVAILTLLLLYYVLQRDLKECVLFAIAAGAAMVPEGLPAAMSVALSLGAQRMLAKKALVKKLLHVESLGSVTTICTDKTGTLTTGKMTVTDFYPNFAESEKNKEDFFKIFTLCNNAVIGEKELGDTLEIALLRFVEKQNHNIKKIKQENEKVYEVPFTSIRKMMSVVCKNQDHYFVYTKGACLDILEICHVSEEEKEKIIAKNDKMAKTGLRVLALAYKDLGNNKDYHKNEIEKDLTFVGLVGLEDPPREGVAQAIKLCLKAQIKVLMITGDYGLTAAAIGEQIGLLKPETKIITGQDLHKMDDEGLKKILADEVIFARIDPGQKLRIVKNLQEMGEVVAVTGDGVNDAPALVKADIGVAMGKIGTDVAKEAADMILLDDHFATIVNAVKEGRRIFDNAIKFVFYIFSSNAGELFVPLFGVIIGLPLPLIAIQILAIDLGTDVFPSLALGVEKEEPDVMEKPPRSKTGRIMSYKMLSHLLQVGLVMGILGLLVYIISLYQSGWRFGDFLADNNPIYLKATASAYAALVFCQVANAFSCRSEKLSILKQGIFSNIWLIYAEIISLFMLWLVVGFPPLQDVFRTAFPTGLTWLLIILAGGIFLAIFEWRKKWISTHHNKILSQRVR